MLTGARAVFAQAGAVAVLATTTVSLALLVLAIRVYPGGTAADPTTIGHSFWTNFLCDLTNEVAINGRPNHASATLALAAMTSLAVAVGTFWLILPLSFGAHPSLGFAIRACGLVSVAGLVAVPLAAGWLHIAAVFASSVPALVAGTLGLVGTVKQSTWGINAILAGSSVAAALFDSILYARSYMVQPRVVPSVLPLFQRVTMLLMLAWMVSVALGLLRKGIAPAVEDGREYRRHSGTKR